MPLQEGRDARHSANEEPNMRNFVTTLVGAAVLLSALPAVASPIQGRSLPQVEKAYPNESYAQYYYRRGYAPRPYYRDGYYYRRDNGAAVAAGVAGLAAGALIGGAIASQAQAQPAAPPPPGVVNPQVAAYCARKYRSYDPGTGTFMANNGMRYVCTYP
jgi:BA14K-like protein